MEALGFLELNSIAKGVEAADKILKTVDVRLVYAKAICPGKYNIMFAGEVSDVESSMENGKKIANEYVVDCVVIPNVHKEVIRAINMATLPKKVNAVGIIEFFSITGAVRVADVCVKAADVVLVEVRLGAGIGGKSFVTLTGDTAAVEESVSRGVESANKDGMLVSSVVIPNPRREIFDSLL